MYSAAWHHVHLYAPRSINPDSKHCRRTVSSTKNDASRRAFCGGIATFGFRRATGKAGRSFPTYDAKCVVAYLMGLNQSHPLKEVRSVGGAPAAAPSTAPAAKVLHPLRQPEDRLLLLNDDAMNDESKTPLHTGQGMDYGEQSDVQQVHAAVQREKREPRGAPSRFQCG